MIAAMNTKSKLMLEPEDATTLDEVLQKIMAEYENPNAFSAND